MIGDIDDPIAPDLAQCRVLVVDDNKLNRVVATTFLEKAGVGQVAQAADGAEALAMIGEFAPDLVVLDLMMPGLDGHETLRRLRADPAQRSLPVLVVSALGGIDDRTKAFALGATDYVEKPINGAELVARARVHLGNRQLVRRLTDYQERSLRDMAMLRAMQASLLPSPELVDSVADRYGLTLDSVFTASSRVGGDLWGLFPLDEARLGLWMVDFSGHGVPAAINSLRLHMLLERVGVTIAHPPALLRDLNTQLASMMFDGGHATMVSAVLDFEDDRVIFAAAGEPRIFVGGPDGVQALSARGAPLGAGPGANYESRSVPFPKGSFLCILSDAAVLADHAGLVPGEAELAALVGSAATAGSAPLGRLMAQVRDDLGGPADDDVTAIWVGRS